MVYMFNELSLKRVDSKQKARSILEELIKATAKAREIGFTEIRLYENILPTLYNIPLYEGYTIDNWLNDHEVNNDLQDLFRLIITSSPLITDTEVREVEFYDRSEFFKNLDNATHRVWGLGAAHIYNTLSVSLLTNDEWQKNTVSISHYYLDQNANEVTEQVNVKHFSSINILETHVEWWEQFRVESLKRSEELWERREEFFPNLIFCDEVQKQLQKIGLSKMLSQIIGRLKSLNEYSKNWKEGNFNYEDVNASTNLRISPESETTINKFGTQRKFSIPKQGKKLFDLHIKTGDLRFHFYPDNDNKRIYVGYIGKHLRIASED